MSLYAIHLANGRTSNTGAMRLMGRLLSGSGVLETTGFAVTATTPTNDMSVKVSGSTTSDNLVIVTTTGDTYYGWNTSQASVTIQSNSEGVIKTDALVAYIDTALTTTTPDNPGGLVLLAVRRGVGLTGAPTSTEIDSATGNKPWLKLAEITVGNGVSSINSGNIVDKRTFLTVASNLLKTISVMRQDNTANSTKANSAVLSGWGFILGNSTALMNKAVTFGTAFTAPPVITVTGLNAVVGADPSAISGFTASSEDSVLSARSITTTGFTVAFQKLTGTFGNTARFGYSWIAIGEQT